jgi:hypothetical protein
VEPCDLGRYALKTVHRWMSLARLSTQGLSGGSFRSPPILRAHNERAVEVLPVADFECKRWREVMPMPNLSTGRNFIGRASPAPPETSCNIICAVTINDAPPRVCATFDARILQGSGESAPAYLYCKAVLRALVPGTGLPRFPQRAGGCYRQQPTGFLSTGT